MSDVQASRMHSPALVKQPGSQALSQSGRQKSLEYIVNSILFG